jgi:hypothetical protein
MISQEEVFDFFQKISIELEKEGYPILNNIIHPFPNIKFEEQLIKEGVENRENISDISDFTDED